MSVEDRQSKRGRAQRVAAASSAAALVLSAALLASGAHAQLATAEGAHEAPSYWRSLTDANYRRAEQLVKQGRAQLYPSLGLGLLLGLESAAHRRVTLENALVRFERAVELAPDHLEARLLLGKALALRETRAVREEREQSHREAIATLEKLRAKAPLYEAQEVALHLGNVHMRSGDFARAAAEYERALRFSTDDGDQAMLLGNLAEATMMQGELVAALTYYERAIRIGEGDGRVLALWGAAVALDRLGEHAEAMAQATRALREDRAPFAVLRQSGVFFVPSYEAYYYDALGALALAQAEREGSERLDQTLLRARSWASQVRPEGSAPLVRVLRDLADLEQQEIAKRWFPLFESARTQSLRAPTPRATERPLNDELPSAREARALLWTLRSLAGFVRYGERAREGGGFVADADDHVAELSRMLELVKEQRAARGR